MFVKRKYILGEEWIYLKIYGGAKFLERKLVQEIYGKLVELRQKKLINHFFFIRYADPEYHLRLRIFTEDPQNIYLVVSTLNTKLSENIQDRSIYRVCYDTYNREIERYGDHSMALAEQLFYFDSVSIIRFLNQTKCSDEHRWLYSMRYIVQLLEMFDFSENNTILFYEAGFQNYAQEFGVLKPVRIIMDKKYRKLSMQIEKAFAQENHNKDWVPITSGISAYRQNSFPIIAQFQKMNLEGILIISLESLVSSIIHMHINRMFRTNQRKYEMLIYYFLLKFTRSRLARLRVCNTANKVDS